MTRSFLFFAKSRYITNIEKLKKVFRFVQIKRSWLCNLLQVSFINVLFRYFKKILDFFISFKFSIDFQP